MTEARVCKNGDGRPFYAKGYCRSCYMTARRTGVAGGPAHEGIDGAQVRLPSIETMDEMGQSTSSREPTNTLKTRPREDDTEGILAMRKKLANLLYLARREVVRGMLYDGLEAWQIKNEFLSRKDLFDQFVVPLKFPDRTLDEDMALIQASGRLRPLERYIDGLKRQLRRANAFSDDPYLPIKERAQWAKVADETLRNLAIQERAINVVTGKGDVPNIDRGYEEEDDDDEEYKLPQVEPSKERMEEIRNALNNPTGT